ncbi:MAG: hypothetical protein P4L83_24865 [Nevskia sp.]|nr:hypothetical protein [Nevskia sp.]
MHIYLSPHHDDVCFSLANLAGRQGGHLVNLYTRSRFVEAKLELPADEAARVETVSRLRCQEDEHFAGAAHLVRHDLGLSEPELVGRRSFDLADLEGDVAALSARLPPYLETIMSGAGQSEPVNVYCPMGIGGHRNHVMTMLAIRDARAVLHRRCSLFLYEDLHYARVPRARQVGLWRAMQAFAGNRMSPLVMPLAPAEVERKMQWISLYASQFGKPPDVADFTPASGLAPGVHEIVWRVIPVVQMRISYTFGAQR